MAPNTTTGIRKYAFTVAVTTIAPNKTKLPCMPSNMAFGNTSSTVLIEQLCRKKNQSAVTKNSK